MKNKDIIIIIKKFTQNNYIYLFTQKIDRYNILLPLKIF